MNLRLLMGVKGGTGKGDPKEETQMKRMMTFVVVSTMALGAAAFAGPGKMKGQSPKKRAAKLMSYDADKSGGLDQRELLVALKDLAKKRHQKVDSNRDGLISAEERAQFRSQRITRMEARNPERATKMKARMNAAKSSDHFQKRMKDLDADGDGRISLAEAQARAEKKAARMMKRLDANKNGTLEEVELQAKGHRGKQKHRHRG